MLSIRLDREREWWAPGRVFERLFQSALENGQLRTDLSEWQHVAETNGGISLVDIEPAVARSLTSGLRAAASAELAQLGDVEERPEDGTYKASLEKLLLLSHEL
jgi:hypothetical protein